MQQYIYKRGVDGLLPVNVPSGAGCRLISRPGELLPVWNGLRGVIGWRGLLVTATRLWLGKRMVYVLSVDGNVVHYGHVSLGFCKHYPVTKDEAVIGPVETATEARGKGYGALGLTLAMNALYEQGWQKFVVDTSEENAAMQRVLAKCGFERVGAFEKQY